MVSRRRVLSGVSLALTGVLAGCSAPTDGEPVKTPNGGTDTPTYDERFTVKQTLYSTYEIGTCFGMPTVVSDEQRKKTLSENQDLALKLVSAYDVSGTDELYKLLQQFNQITLTKQSNGRYSFVIRDGDCCTIRIIRGVIAGNEIQKEEETKKTVPC